MSDLFSQEDESREVQRARLPVDVLLRDVSSSAAGTRFRAVASTGSVDRDGESIDPTGWVIPSPLPKLFFGHAGYREIRNVIGKLTKAEARDGALIVEAELFDAIPEHTNAKIAAGLLKLGGLDQGSVGFDPFEWMERDGRSGARQKGEPFPGPSVGRRYTKQELLEFSLVPVPSNVDSRVLEVAKALRDLESIASGRGSVGVFLTSLAGDTNRQTTAPRSSREPRNAFERDCLALGIPLTSREATATGISKELLVALTQARDLLAGIVASANG